MKKIYYLIIGILISAIFAGCATPEDPIQQVTITLTAYDMAFDSNSITVPPVVLVNLVFINQDEGEPHNFALYETSEFTDPIFVGEIITGEETITYEFNAPIEEGTYYFRCDVHPEMNGEFVVQMGSTGSTDRIDSNNGIGSIY